MPRILIQIASLVLIPCLIADPTLASLHAIDPLQVVGNSSDAMLFTREALIERIASAIFTGKSDNAGSHNRVREILESFGMRWRPLLVNGEVPGRIHHGGGRMASKSEFADGGFKGCIREWVKDTGSNDEKSFRRNSRLLADGKSFEQA